MSLSSAIQLVKSLSGTEKRFFRLYTSKLSVNKSYLQLFEIIDANTQAEHFIIEELFRTKYPLASIHNTSRYLLKVLTDCLIQLKVEKDPLFQFMQGIMRVKVLQGRALLDESNRELKKTRSKARSSQQHLIEYLTYRLELDAVAQANFVNIEDRQLVEMQMKAKGLLKDLNHIQDHHSLFELLKSRLVHSGKITSEENRKKLNDLLLSEIALITGKSGNTFESKKLHLLFQSFFFTDIGDYGSALTTFASLSLHFEKNLNLLEHPPTDYLSVLNGILDSLHVLGIYEKIGIYTAKLRLLDQSGYPEYFRYQVRKTISVFQLAMLTAHKMFREAKEYILKMDPTELTAYNLDEEKQWELYFYHSLTFMGLNDWKKAHYYINEVLRKYSSHKQFLICKAVRILNIIIYYEKGDIEYLEYELRSYKRFFRIQQMLKSEKLLFRFIKIGPAPNRKLISELHQKQILSGLASLQKDRYERQLLKYFDFTEWMTGRLTKGQAL